MSTAAKRPKLDGDKRKGNYYSHHSKKKFMQVGQKGFLVTCNFREKECIKESYNLFNSYYSGDDDDAVPKEKETDQQSDNDDDVEEEDIATQLANEIQASKVEAKKARFQVIDTQTTNCIFVEAKIEDPLALGVRIVRDIAANKCAKTRFLLRLLPVEIVCRAALADIMNTAERLFDKHFLGEPKTFAVMFNRRYNNDVKRDVVIQELASIIQAKNAKHKVDLKNPQLSVIVEVIKGFCCLSVVPDYLALKKYNLVELCAAAATGTTSSTAASQSSETQAEEEKEKQTEKDEEKGQSTTTTTDDPPV